ncbi:MAG: BlaI/MecI/CopY family transcriptional regulator [Vicinamibacterales bacterium]
MLGPLEQQVLDALWERSSEQTVRDLHAAFPEIAYTTLMTTLDRLFRKGLLARVRQGRAFAYRHRWTRDELAVLLAREVMEGVLPHDSEGLRPVMSCFVDLVETCDPALLGELETLVRNRRPATPAPGAPATMNRGGAMSGPDAAAPIAQGNGGNEEAI